MIPYFSGLGVNSFPRRSINRTPPSGGFTRPQFKDPIKTEPLMKTAYKLANLTSINPHAHIFHRDKYVLKNESIREMRVNSRNWMR